MGGTTEVRLRPTTPADLAVLRALFDAPSFAGWGGSGRLSDDDVAQKYTGARLPEVECFLVIQDESCVGLAVLHPADEGDGGGLDLIVLPEARGRGVGRTVVARLTERAVNERGWTRLTVDPHLSNEAGIAFWRSVGFVALRVVTDDPERAPYVLMERTLNSPSACVSFHTPEPARAGRGTVAIRPYRGDDAEATLTIFLDAVTITAARDYSPEQIAAWARREQRSVTTWDRQMASRNSAVAVLDGETAGFSDVSAEGDIHMMFVAPRFVRRGVATALLRWAETHARRCGAARLTADVSITARPFFASRGFAVEAEQHPVVDGVGMTNFRMVKRLRI